MLAARAALVLESRVAGRAAPIDGVRPDFRNAELVGAEAGRALGFGGKLAIHPAQVAPIRAAFLPDAEAIESACRVLAGAQENGADAVDGRMVDRPLIEQARRIPALLESGSRHTLVG